MCHVTSPFEGPEGSSGNDSAGLMLVNSGGMTVASAGAFESVLVGVMMGCCSYALVLFGSTV